MAPYSNPQIDVMSVFLKFRIRASVDLRVIVKTNRSYTRMYSQYFLKFISYFIASNPWNVVIITALCIDVISVFLSFIIKA